MRSNDTQILFSSVARAHPRAREIVWKFMKDNWNVLTQRYPGQNNLPKIIEVSQIALFIIVTVGELFINPRC